MAFCNAHGIPHSEFLSWDDNDQDKALGFEREQAKVCSGCGTRQEEWDEDHYAYVADSRRCIGCELRAQEEEQIPSGTKGVKVFLMPRKVYEAQQAQIEQEEMMKGA